jgi:hypothetical protein
MYARAVVRFEVVVMETVVVIRVQYFSATSVLTARR